MSINDFWSPLHFTSSVVAAQAAADAHILDANQFSILVLDGGLQYRA